VVVAALLTVLAVGLTSGCALIGWRGRRQREVTWRPGSVPNRRSNCCGSMSGRAWPSSRSSSREAQVFSHEVPCGFSPVDPRHFVRRD
jgi:hypothetical protein